MHVCVYVCASVTLFLCCVFTMLVPVDAVLWSLGIVCSLHTFWSILCWTCCLLTCAYWTCSMCFSQSASPNHLRSQSDLSTPTTPPPYSLQSRVSLTWLISPCLRDIFILSYSVSRILPVKLCILFSTKWLRCYKKRRKGSAKNILFLKPFSRLPANWVEVCPLSRWTHWLC